MSQKPPKIYLHPDGTKSEESPQQVKARQNMERRIAQRRSIQGSQKAQASAKKEANGFTAAEIADCRHKGQKTGRISTKSGGGG